MKHLQFFLFALCCCGSFAQERPSPYTAVESFFEAFHAKDSLAMQNSFVPEARLMRAVTQVGRAPVQINDLQRFIRAVATREASPKWEERLGKPIVQEHLNLATVWVPFRFYLDDALSHCGYNAFSVVWVGDRWKILSLIDTGTKDCDQLLF